MNLILIKSLLTRGPHYDVGLAYIASSLEKNHKVKLLDLAFHIKSYSRYLLPNLEDFKPDAIIFSVNSFHFHNALKIAFFIRKHRPYIPLIYVGVHPTLRPEETIQNPLVDGICIGEGEDTLREYLDKLESNQEPGGIAGLWYKDKFDNIIKNRLRPFREDLDSLPFPNWDYFEMDKCLRLYEPFRGGIKIFSSRGCPYDCSYCVSPSIKKAVPGRFYRMRSPENIIEEIRSNLRKYYTRGFRHLKFGDDIFGLDLNHMERFCYLFVKEGLSKKLTWSCQTRADIITEDWAKIVSRAGCVMVSLGIESGDEHIRMNVYNKKITDEQIMNTVKILRKNNIMYRMNMLICGPEDSKESIEKSLQLIQKTKPAFATFLLYRLLPKTPIVESLLNNKNCEARFRRMFEKPFGYRIASPLKNTNYLQTSKINNILLKIKLKRIYGFIILGIKLKGIIFIVDIIKVIICLMKNNRPLFHTYSFTNLECNTIVRYLFNKNRFRNAT